MSISLAFAHRFAASELRPPSFGIRPSTPVLRTEAATRPVSSSLPPGTHPAGGEGCAGQRIGNGTDRVGRLPNAASAKPALVCYKAYVK